MSDINKARNQVAHGHDSNMTFEDAKEKFDKSIKIIEKLDEVLKVNLQQNIDNNKEYDDKTTID
jgi:ribosome-binding protein aMBF1 (putative translation factor)